MMSWLLQLPSWPTLFFVTASIWLKCSMAFSTSLSLFLSFTWNEMESRVGIELRSCLRFLATMRSFKERSEPTGKGFCLRGLSVALKKK